MYSKYRMMLLNIGFREVVGKNRFESEICTVEIDKMTLTLLKVIVVDGKEQYIPTDISTLKKEIDEWEQENYDY